MAKFKGKIKQSLLIIFVSVCSLLMVLTIGFSIRENYDSDHNDGRGIILNLEQRETERPTATPTIDPEATPIPTETDWEPFQG